MRHAHLAAALLLLGGCGSPGSSDGDERADGTAPAARGNQLVGVWASDVPAEFQGEGLRTRMADGLTAYDSRNRFAYRGRLTIFGAELPDEGMHFAVNGRGTYARDGERLTEDYDEVRVTPEHEDGELRRLAGELAAEMTAAEPSVSRITSLEGGRLALRTADGRDATFTRRQ